MKNYVEMGSYYNSNPYGLVRTVCRAFEHETGEAVIAYVNIEEGGTASDIFFMPEVQFKNIFLKKFYEKL